MRQRLTFFLDPVRSEDQLAKFDLGPQQATVHGASDTIRHNRVVLARSDRQSALNAVLDKLGPFELSWRAPRPYLFAAEAPFHTALEYGLHVVADSQQNLRNLFPELPDASILTGNNTQVSFCDPFSSIEDVRVLIQHLGLSQYVDSTVESVRIVHGLRPFSPREVHYESDLVIETLGSAIYEQLRAPASPNDALELGIVHPVQAYSTATDIACSGLIRNLAKPDADKAFFHLQPKHVFNGGRFSSQFSHPLGLHPHYVIALSDLVDPQPDVPGACRLYAKYTLPKSLFLDRYQLADLTRTTPGQPARGRLVALQGEADLEAPVWSVAGWGSEAVVQINVPDQASSLSFDLAMHSRYESPLANVTASHHTMPKPLVFWACLDLDDERPTFEYPSLGYEALFPPDTVFHHLRLSDRSVFDAYIIPVAPLDSYEFVSMATFGVILAGFIYLLHVVATTYQKLQRRAHLKTE